jgi:hypothetical protein
MGIDFTVENHCSIFCFVRKHRRLLSGFVSTFMPLQRDLVAVVIEHAYVCDILDGIRDDGLCLTQAREVL